MIIIHCEYVHEIILISFIKGMNEEWQDKGQPHDECANNKGTE